MVDSESDVEFKNKNHGYPLYMVELISFSCPAS